ncbi:MAG: MoaD/ThiS family protein [Nitrospirae bacterium]|nr:MoaD/ThiS family protein [Nitrospirota bacterium]
MIVSIPTPLRSYTAGQSEVPADGASLEAVIATLDRRYPGIRFRIVTEQDTIRRHIRIFINGEQVPDLAVPVRPDDQIHIVCALSGG